MLEGIIHEQPRLKNRKKLLFLILLASFLLTGVGLSGALYFGELYYHFRRNVLHQERLAGMVSEEPTAHQVTEGLKEKAPLLACPRRPDELEALASQWSDRKTEILDKGTRWSSTRVYDAGDMVYFIYFDEHDVMRDFIYVDHPEFRRR